LKEFSHETGDLSQKPEKSVEIGGRKKSAIAKFIRVGILVAVLAGAGYYFCLPIIKAKKYEQYFAQGKQYAEKGKWDEAIESYNKALSYKIGDKKTDNELRFVQSYMNRKKYSKAANEFQKAVNLGATGEVKRLLAKAKKKKKYEVGYGRWKIIDRDLVIVGTGRGNYLMCPRDKNSAGCYYGRTLNWQSANDWAQNLVYKGYNDWRLPTKNELRRLLRRLYYKTYVNYAAGDYWFDIKYSKIDNAGYEGYTRNACYVRAVRSSR